MQAGGLVRAATRLLGGDRVPMLAGVLLVALMAVLQGVGFASIDRLGPLLFDAYQRAAPRPYEDTAVRVVDIDDESIRRFGQWPWPRTEIARLNARLTQAGASAIAYDIVFSEPDRTSPARLAAQLRASGVDSATLAGLSRLPDNDAVLADAFGQSAVVLGLFLTNDRVGPGIAPKAGFGVAGSPPTAVPVFRRGIESLPALDAAAAGKGFVSLAAGGDGIVRQVPLLARQGGELLPSLSLEALRVAQGAGSVTVRTSDASGETSGAPGDIVAVRVGEFELPTTASGSLWLHYTRPAPQRIVPAWKVLDEATPPTELEALVAGRIVLVGAGAIGLRDLIATPLSARELGVVAHAQALEQAILGKFLLRPDWAPGLERGLLIALGLALALLLPRLGALRGALLGGIAVAGIGAGSWLAFGERGYLLDPTWPVLTLAAVYLAETAMTYYREERRRAYIHGAFDRYLSPELVRRIAADPDRLELGGEDREMTVLFADVRNFSGISEHMPPKGVIGFLIGLLTPLCNVLLARKATIDKFIGDAIVAFWNAPLDDPDHHRNAARASLEMVAALDALNAAPPQDWPGAVKIGVGLNSGLCCVGNMGSAQRLSYSLIGDTVNLASRIEGLTKLYGVSIAVGSDLAAHLDGFALLELDKVQVVGRDTPEQIYVLLGDEAVVQRADFCALAANHAEMIAAYRSRGWGEAGKLIDRLTKQGAPLGLGKLYALYSARIADFADNPPGADWDAVFVAPGK